MQHRRMWWWLYILKSIQICKKPIICSWYHNFQFPFVINSCSFNLVYNGNNKMILTTALKTAYSISEPVRCYLNAINREKISYVCSLKSPKMWATVYQLMDGCWTTQISYQMMLWYLGVERKKSIYRTSSSIWDLRKA